VAESNALVLGSISGINGATASVNVGIGTTTPLYSLDVHGTGNFTGPVNFAPGQTFPGTITSVNPGTALTSSGTGSNVTLNVDTTKVPQLSAANTFNGDQTINGAFTATATIPGPLGSFTTGLSMIATEGGDAFEINSNLQIGQVLHVSCADLGGDCYGIIANGASGGGLFTGGRAVVAEGASEFDGDVAIYGTLTKAAGAFKIDHPLDPANKYLTHSFVESPDMMNIYNGTVLLDGNGGAWINLPDWFEALNRDFRYQLTAIGVPSPNLYVADEVSGNRFRIAGGSPGGKVSWQVTGIRHDAYADAHRLAVEEDKPEGDHGYYLHPQVHGQPPEKSIFLKRFPRIGHADVKPQ
jgi:hypothetical protein